MAPTETQEAKLRAANCPFYGFSMYLWANSPNSPNVPFMLLSNGDGSNRCALFTASHTPCWMEINHQPVDWKLCPYVNQIRVGLSQTPEADWK